MIAEHPRVSVQIDAPIEVVWQAMIETAAYAAWSLAGPERFADGFRRHAEALKARSEALTGESRLDH